MCDLRTLVVLVVLCIATACSSGDGSRDDDASGAAGAALEMAPVELKLASASPDAPRLAFQATKNGTIGVPGTFDSLKSTITLRPGDLTSLAGRLEVQLGSVNTENTRRDRNVREVLFGLSSESLGQAAIELHSFVPEKKYLPVGKSTKADVGLRMTLRGLTAEWAGRVQVNREDQQRWVVTTAEPVALSLETLGLGHHATALKRLCRHEDLSDSVTITVRLVFVAGEG